MKILLRPIGHTKLCWVVNSGILLRTTRILHVQPRIFLRVTLIEVRRHFPTNFCFIPNAEHDYKIGI